MFYDILKEMKVPLLGRSVSEVQFNSVMNRDLLNLNDLAILLGDISSEQLEAMAVRANRESIWNFGRTVQLFTPLYLGNYCENRCIYCAFNETYSVKRKKLTLEEVREECVYTAESDLDELLLLTGESRKHTDVAYIADSAKIALEYFNSVAVEIYPLEVNEYRRLAEVGVSGLTIYQETYDEERYDALHLAGPKKNYHYRLDAPERGASAGINRIQIGALLGLSEPLTDAYKTAAHLDYLLKKYSEVEWSISMPRLKDIENGHFIGQNIEDRLFVQILLAMRLIFPKVGISVSTRENSKFREQLIPLGVNKLSAGVSTAVGRKNGEDKETKQFEISDTSSVEEVKAMVTKRGYQVVFRNWALRPGEISSCRGEQAATVDDSQSGKHVMNQEVSVCE